MAVLLSNIVSELALDLKAKGYDDRISFRQLYSKFQSKLEYFLRLESKTRELYRDVVSWQSISCIELIDAVESECYAISCSILKRSVNKLPEAYNTAFGPALRILSMDNTKEYRIIDESLYTSFSNREYSAALNYSFFRDGYLYIPNYEHDVIKGLIIAKNSNEVKKFNGEIGCLFPLEAELFIPDYLITLAKKEVMNELFASKQITEDERGDENTNTKQ